MTNDLHPLQRGYHLRQDAFGNLDLVWSDGQVVERVTPVRAFPFSDPEQGLSLVDTEGHNTSWPSVSTRDKPCSGSEKGKARTGVTRSTT